MYSVGLYNGMVWGCTVHGVRWYRTWCGMVQCRMLQSDDNNTSKVCNIILLTFVSTYHWVKLNI